MKQRKGREWRWFDQYAHDVANGIVADAVRVGATHVAFERLTHIRRRISKLPKFQQWFFHRVQEYAQYKLEGYGIECRQVNPRNTSRACSRTDCDCVSAANREEKTFRCTACGYEVNADYNAAKNVGFALLDSLSDSADCRGRSLRLAASPVWSGSPPASPPLQRWVADEEDTDDGQHQQDGGDERGDRNSDAVDERFTGVIPNPVGRPFGVVRGESE
ncbi:hypothetical protein BRD02_10990 [Halobacteriales archaeon QS_8_69_73]|nr:MAG: hypothetical protein BRD02_10990 [Halobacteriales archaeon QS_8_69_73]